MLIYFVKLLINLTTFLYLKYIYNLDSIAIILNSKGLKYIAKLLYIINIIMKSIIIINILTFP